jgi:hypothetical protein
MLLHQTMKKRPFPLMAFVFLRWLGFRRGPSKTLEISQLKTARAIGVILQGRLRKIKRRREKGHNASLGVCGKEITELLYSIVKSKKTEQEASCRI